MKRYPELLNTNQAAEILNVNRDALFEFACLAKGGDNNAR